MNKIKVKLAFVFVLCGLLSTMVFAEVDEGKNGQQSENCTVKFDLEGGKGEFPDKTVESGKPLGENFPRDNPTRKGYKFDGWRTEKDGKGTKFTKDTSVVKNMTVYAKWTEDLVKFTVTFNPDNENKLFDQTVESGKPLGENFPRDNPTRKGYKFDGWRTEKDGKGTKFTKDTSVVKNMTVYAKWTEEKFKVTFDLNGGTFQDGTQQNPIEQRCNECVNPLPVPEKNDHKFLGWVDKDKNEDNEFNENTPVQKDMTVVAKWKPFSEMLDNLNDGNDEIKKDIDKLSSNIFYILLTTAAIALVLLALTALNFIATNKMRKKIPAAIQEKFDELAKKQKDAKQTILEKIGDGFTMRPQTADGTAQIEGLKNDVRRLENEKSEYQNRITGLEAENRSLKENKRIADGIKSGSLDPVSVFNDWASNPSTPLPRAFYYIEGEMKIRGKRELKESQNADSKWISNREGSQKYLFPNPNSFSQMTNISELYKMDLSKLKAKGQNRVKIIKPCDMTNNGFVEFPGELEIL
ncbi:MAG: hypothetical protein Pg6A_03570 [Termitinemataceae bacterium]|nr:MAG: hypothetical protein Pg6A_03570 [Termitinemataceae bacterium]